MIVGRTPGHVMLWIEGVEEPRTRVSIPLGAPVSLTLEHLLDVLDRFEAECRSQEFRAKIWLKADKWIPAKEAEKVVQGDLRLWLRALFKGLSRRLTRRTRRPAGRTSS